MYVCLRPSGYTESRLLQRSDWIELAPLHSLERTMNILLVEDEVTAVTINRLALMKSGHDVVVARDGMAATSILEKQTFDAVVTDWMMPNRNGLELLRWIRANLRPVPLLIMTTALGLPEAYAKALEAGADEYLAKPVSITQLREALARAERKYSQRIDSIPHAHTRISVTGRPDFAGIAIGAGSGGAGHLKTILGQLAASVRASMFVVVHGPIWAVNALGEKLSREIAIPVQVVSNDMPIEPGRVYIASGDRHMNVSTDGHSLVLIDGEPENYARPAIDPLMRSLATAFGGNSVGIVLGGSSCDGTIGAGYIHAAGGYVIVQNPNEAIVPQMVQNVITLGLADRVLSVSQMSRELTTRVQSHGHPLSKSTDRRSSGGTA
jgi:two-component system chemotaxis response regulator CheB